MTALQLQTLLDDNSCIRCFSDASTIELLKLSLLNRIAQTNPVTSFTLRAGITNAAQISALNALVASAKSNGWWYKCDLIYPFVGGTALAHAQNLKSSVFTITWNGTVTHDANGITGNGTTGYGDTGYMPASSGQMLVNSTHAGIYRRTTGNSSAYFGCSKSGSELTAIRFVIDNGTVQLALNDDNSTEAVTLSSLAFSIFTRIDAAFKRMYTGGVDKPFAKVSSSLPPSPLTLFVLCNNDNGTPSNFQTANLSALTAGSGMTLTQYNAMATDWQTFQTALGRQV